MKLLRHLTLLSIAFMLFSCGGSGKPGEVSENNASEIIEYYNKAVETFRKAKNVEDYEKVIKVMGSKNRREFPPVFNNFTLFRDSATLTKPGRAFSQSQRDTLTMAFRGWYAANEEFSANYATFKAYRDAEDYKDDNWAKAVELSNANQQLLDEIQAYRSLVYSIISPMADEAEMLLMDGNPYKDHIMAGKKVFEYMGTIYDEATEDKVDAAAIDQAYNALEAQVAAARELAPIPDEESAMRYYGKFLDEVDKYLGVVRKAKRDNRYTDSVVRDLKRAYDYAVSQYNNFVD